jgi:hypothetical protein
VKSAFTIHNSDSFPSVLFRRSNAESMPNRIFPTGHHCARRHLSSIAKFPIRLCSVLVYTFIYEFYLIACSIHLSHLIVFCLHSSSPFYSLSRLLWSILRTLHSSSSNPSDLLLFIHQHPPRPKNSSVRSRSLIHLHLDRPPS